MTNKEYIDECKRIIAECENEGLRVKALRDLTMRFVDSQIDED